MDGYAEDLARFERLGFDQSSPDPGRIPRWPWGDAPTAAAWEMAQRHMDGGFNGQVALVRLCDLLALVPIIRGVYERSQPNTDDAIALREGGRLTRWLTRHPVWHRSSTPALSIYLREILPLPHPEGGHWIYTWRLQIRGERQDRVAAELAQSLRGPWGANV